MKNRHGAEKPRIKYCVSGTLLARALTFVLALPLLVSASPQNVFGFWSKPNSASDPRFVSIEEHPCGEVALARIMRLPPLETDPSFGPEEVVEYDPSYSVVHRWPTPVDSYPVGIDGNRLLIEIYREQYWITPDGVFQLNRHRRHILTKPVSCPANLLAAGSNYSECIQVKDLKSRRSRLLKYEAVCT